MTETKQVCAECGQDLPAKDEAAEELTAEVLRKRLPTALPVGGIITPV